MPALKNQRQERFVQELAKGKTQIEAYTQAGYKPSDGNAATLFGKPDIQARLAELAERTAVRTELTAATVTERLLRIAEVAEKTGIAIGDDGQPVVSSPKHLAVARAALMDAAKINGLVIDRSEHGQPGDFDKMTDDELAEYVRSEAAALGLGGQGASPKAGKAGVRAKPGSVH